MEGRCGGRGIPRMIMPGPAAEHGDIGHVGRHPTGGGAQGDAGSLSSGLTESRTKPLFVVRPDGEAGWSLSAMRGGRVLLR